ncbi:MAG: FG-GAP-like repeat-containing protein [Planctomycetaceae bacterium]
MFFVFVAVGIVGRCPPAAHGDDGPSTLSAVQRTEIERFCADCHAMPGAAAFPKSAWMDEVRRGFKFYANSGRSDLAVPRVLDVAKFFRDAAPDKIPLPPGAVTPLPERSRFQRQVFPPVEPGGQPAVSFLSQLPLTRGEAPWLLACDMKSGQVLKWRGLGSDPIWKPVAQLDHPSHAQLCDLDADGALDLVVADLGTFTPSDKLAGRVVWLRRVGEGSFEPQVLQSDLGRVADVQPGDFDGDGDLDLVVAEFGWQKAGRVLLLRNLGNPQVPKFALEEIDPRHGTIHVPTVDLNGDGHLDFIALISQEHEVVEAFLNDGTGSFRT